MIECVNDSMVECGDGVRFNALVPVVLHCDSYKYGNHKEHQGLSVKQCGNGI